MESITEDTPGRAAYPGRKEVCHDSNGFHVFSDPRFCVGNFQAMSDKAVTIVV